VSFFHRAHKSTGCYGPTLSEMFRPCATALDRILRGAKPGNVPIEQPTNCELVICLTTNNALGLTIPKSMLLRAGKVIP
jgi:putative tryptophan/tyrosine transport system substrate-binding protein